MADMGKKCKKYSDARLLVLQVMEGARAGDLGRALQRAKQALRAAVGWWAIVHAIFPSSSGLGPVNATFA